MSPRLAILINPGPRAIPLTTVGVPPASNMPSPLAGAALLALPPTARDDGQS
jgi:hypothetical protein